MDIHKNAGRRRTVEPNWCGVWWSKGRARRRWRRPSGSAPRPCASGWHAFTPKAKPGSGSLLAAASPAPADAGGSGRPDRGAAPPALDRQADRRRARCLAGHRQPDPQAPRAHPARGLEPAEPVRRYEWERPGDLIHIDIKKLGRFDHVGHRITGDRRPGLPPRRRLGVRPRLHRRRLAARLLPDPARREEGERHGLEAAVAYYNSLGVEVARVMTDNGSCYRSKAFRNACRDLGLKHIRTRPYTPKTNGKAERFIQTALREWAYAKPTPPRTAAPTSCRSGCTDTTGIGRTQPKVKTTISQTRPRRGQPVEAPQLEHRPEAAEARG